MRLPWPCDDSRPHLLGRTHRRDQHGSKSI
jgi:hypothetical protein